MVSNSSINSFKNSTAVVTGAASGIGRALTGALIERGAVVYAADVDEAGLASLAECYPAAALHPVRVDITDADQVKALLDRAVEDTSKIDYLFNNSGIVTGGDLEDMTLQQWRRIIDINLWGVVYGCQFGYPHMLRQGLGHIVNTAYSAGVMPVARSAAYTATKHAVVGLSTSLRAEGVRHVVRVSVTIPGLVETNIFDSATNLGSYSYATAMDKVPVNKISPERAAEYILAGVAKNKQDIVFPRINAAIVPLNRLAPNLMSKLVAKQV